VSLGTKERVSWHVIISIQTVLYQIKQNQWASLFCGVIATIEYENISLKNRYIAGSLLQ
jgi:hypothetical protein